ncbi:MAG: hypothetical protein GXY87_00705 [Tissierellia bacterium]|nr:hypothetical protein [Tissierellia bacterium]
MRYHSEQEITVTGNETDAAKRLHLHNLLDHAQILDIVNCENKLKITNDLMNEKNVVWILLSIHIKILKEMPMEKDTLVLHTWSRGVKGLKFYRENRYYKDSIHEDNLLGVSTSEWIVADKDDHTPKRPSVLMDLKDLKERSHPEVACVEKVEKLKGFVKDGFGEKVYSHIVNFSDLDVNVHLHNTHYIKFAFDAFALHKKYNPEKHEIVFNDFIVQFEKELFYGENLDVYVKEEEGVTYFEGVNEEGKSSFIIKADIKMNTLK